MKTLFSALISGAFLATSLAAIAGPDFQMLEQARKAKALRVSHQAAAATHPPGAGGTPTQAEADAKHAQMMKDCDEMMKKSPH